MKKELSLVVIVIAVYMLVHSRKIKTEG
jgi:hypothetical protein